MEGALSGIRVLDFTRAVAGAFGSMLLSDMGAEVHKVENVPSVDPPITDVDEIELTEDIAHFWGLNRGKRGICLDLQKPSAREVVYDLVKKSDVIYDNFRPGVLEKLGIDYDTVKRYNPRIVSCSISGYGETGPWKYKPSYDVVAQAITGIMSLTGEPGRMPCQCGVAIGDLSSGLFSAFGIVCALLNRDRTGVGQRVETSILDALLSYQSYRVPQVFGLGMEFGPHPRRSGAGQVPYGAFKTKDGSWITLAAGSAHFWEALCKAIDREYLITDSRFNTLEKRRENEDEVSQIIDEAFLAKTAEEWVQILSDVGVPAGKVNTIEEAFLQPQAQARNMLITFAHPFGKKMKCAGNPIKMSTSKVEEYKPAPGIGEHTQEVLSNLLGYSSAKIAKLRKERAIWYSERGVTYGSGPMARF